MKKFWTGFIFLFLLLGYTQSQGMNFNDLARNVSFIIEYNTLKSIREDTIPLFEETDIISNDTMYNYKFAIGDYDNDNDYDILLASKSNSGQLFIRLLNNKNGLFSVQKDTILTGLESKIDAAAWGDYDNDNNLDLFLSGYNSSLDSMTSKIYRNIGNLSFVEQNNSELDLIDASSVSWGDYDNDGYLDLFLTGWANDSHRVSKIFHNEGNGIFIKQMGVNLLSVTQGNGKWVDFNNDGLLDIILTGMSGPFGIDSLVTQIYINNGNKTFTKQANINIIGVGNSDVDCKDYDNDGNIDIAITGMYNYTVTMEGQLKCTKVYHNEWNNIFIEVVNLKGLWGGSVEFGDFDNDGDLDLLVFGSDNEELHLIIYENQGSNVFSEKASFTYPDYWDNVLSKWCDVDNDRDLDIILMASGYYESGHFGSVLKIVKNNSTIKNTQPIEPTNLLVNTNNADVILSWDKSISDITFEKKSFNNTTINKVLNYNYYIEPISDSKLFGAPMSDLDNGFHKVINFGNVGNKSNNVIIKNLPPGDYAWSVQAIDNSNLGSRFAPKGYFNIKPLDVKNDISNFLRIYPNPVKDILCIEVVNSFSNLYSVKIYDTFGKLMESIDKCQPKQTINLDKFNSGTYIIRLINSIKTMNFKIIKL